MPISAPVAQAELGSGVLAKMFCCPWSFRSCLPGVSVVLCCFGLPNVLSEYFPSCLRMLLVLSEYFSSCLRTLLVLSEYYLSCLRMLLVLSKYYLSCMRMLLVLSKYSLDALEKSHQPLLPGVSKYAVKAPTIWGFTCLLLVQVSPNVLSEYQQSAWGSYTCLLLVLD